MRIFRSFNPLTQIRMTITDLGPRPTILPKPLPVGRATRPSPHSPRFAACVAMLALLLGAGGGQVETAIDNDLLALRGADDPPPDSEYARRLTVSWDAGSVRRGPERAWKGGAAHLHAAPRCRGAGSG
jgi:hypothetical protein